jgi:hypothetical protein
VSGRTNPHAAENAALAYDLAVAERIHGRGTPTATRLAAYDRAQREGTAW